MDDKHCSPSVTHDVVTTYEVADDRIGSGWIELANKGNRIRTRRVIWRKDETHL